VKNEEAFRICRMAKALSPAQAVDEYTPEAWALILRTWRYADAEAALEVLGAEQEFIHVSHIVKRIKRLRAERLTAFGALPTPPVSIDPDDTTALQRWQAETTRAIADGTLTPSEPMALPRHVVDVAELMPRPPTENQMADFRRSLHAAREALCTPHKLPADSCSLCAETRRRAELQDHTEGDVA
jgi:hypothetical protein